MQNRITNRITFGRDDASLAAFQRMLHEMRAEDQPLGSFDFNKLIPMPRELNIECSSKTNAGLKLYTDFLKERVNVAIAALFETKSEQSVATAVLLSKWGIIAKKEPDIWDLGKRAYQNIQKHGHPTWREWRLEHWGTKWNAYQCAPLDNSADTMVFHTVWNSIPKLVKALSGKYPNQTITYRWADEDIGHNVGEFTLRGGEIVGANVPENDSQEAYEMAAKIIGIDLSDPGVELTTDTRSYAHRNSSEALTADESGLKHPTAPTEQAKAPKKKRGTERQDR